MACLYIQIVEKPILQGVQKGPDTRWPRGAQ